MTEDERAPVPKSPLGSTYWLIAKDGNGPLEVFTIGEEALPVFSFREEAELFLGLGELGDGWQARESGTGETLSILYGPCRGKAKVVLDPLPEKVAGRTVGLVGLDRERFAERILNGGKHRGLATQDRNRSSPKKGVPGDTGGGMPDERAR